MLCVHPKGNLVFRQKLIVFDCDSCAFLYRQMILSILSMLMYVIAMSIDKLVS